ncbi:putative Amino acid transporter [Spironucleus salmonicida]|uniref:Amino acid transporter n=1 Tax=Spironucleus salmonicida TaxID=348837 RepID=V6LPG8_9EUKA|nr:putative Amino acid transporter [Spironucleus salmonicida]|eukprot:EST45611.1 Amino acid transporter family protein [Spironucleus salmonicida]
MSNEEDIPLYIDEPSRHSELTLSLLPDPAKQTPLTCIFNFVNSTLGSGVLTLPYVFFLLGYILAPIVSICFSLLALASFYMLASAAKYTNRYQYSTICDKLFKTKFAGIVCSLLQIIFIQGALISYIVVIKDNMWFFTPEQKLYRDLTVSGLILFIVLPLTFLRTLNKLKFTSYLIIFVFIYIIAALIIFNVQNDTPGQVVAFNVNFSSLTAISLSIHSYSSQYNFINLFYELKQREKNIHKVIITNQIIVTSIYLTVGFLGYFCYKNQVKPDILSNFQGSVLAKIANFSMIFFMIIHYPLPVYGMRKAVESFIVKKNREASNFFRILIATLIVSISLVIGIFVNSIDNIIDFSSTIAGGGLGFIYPPLLLAIICKREQRTKLFVGCIIQLIIGISLVLTGFVSVCFKWFGSQ